MDNETWHNWNETQATLDQIEWNVTFCKWAILLCLFLLVVGGKGCTVTEPPNNDLRPAFYLGQHDDYKGLGHKGQPPLPLNQFGLVVWNPGVSVAKVREAAPGTVHLGYVDIRSVPRWGAEGSPQHAERTLFAADSLYWLTPAGERVETWKNTWELRYTVDNAVARANLIGSLYAEWDGVYIDNCAPNLSPFILRQLPISEDAWAATEVQFDIYRNVFLRSLRSVLPDSVKIVGNTGSVGLEELESLPLDGVTSEEHWPHASQSFLSFAGARNPSLCVAWEWDPSGLVRQGLVRYRPKYEGIDRWPIPGEVQEYEED